MSISTCLLLHFYVSTFLPDNNNNNNDDNNNHNHKFNHNHHNNNINNNIFHRARTPAHAMLPNMLRNSAPSRNGGCRANAGKRSPNSVACVWGINLLKNMSSRPPSYSHCRCSHCNCCGIKHQVATRAAKPTQQNWSPNPVANAWGINLLKNLSSHSPNYSIRH